MGGDATAAVRSARERFAAIAAELTSRHVPDDALAVWEPATRRLGVPRRARLRPAGRVWRIGVLLLDAGGSVHGTGRVTRAVPPGHPGHMAASTEERREVRAAAFRGPFAAGETVHYDTVQIELTVGGLTGAAGPLLLRDDRLVVRWSLSAGDDAARDLEAYLAERLDLLLHPPQGAT